MVGGGGRHKSVGAEQRADPSAAGSEMLRCLSGRCRGRQGGGAKPASWRPRLGLAPPIRFVSPPSTRSTLTGAHKLLPPVPPSLLGVTFQKARLYSFLLSCSEKEKAEKKTREGAEDEEGLSCSEPFMVDGENSSGVQRKKTKHKMIRPGGRIQLLS